MILGVQKDRSGIIWWLGMLLNSKFFARIFHCAFILFLPFILSVFAFERLQESKVNKMPTNTLISWTIMGILNGCNVQQREINFNSALQNLAFILDEYICMKNCFHFELEMGSFFLLYIHFHRTIYVSEDASLRCLAGFILFCSASKKVFDSEYSL